MKKYGWVCYLGVTWLLNWDVPAPAQILPDNSLGTQVVPNQNVKGLLSDRIDGGTIRGSNLFHSFSEFNVPAGRGVYFSNPDSVTNIFTRVTGANPSNINGTLGVLGGANLFFLNPNGIIFSASGRLDVQGSFLGSTSNNIHFADGTQFSTTIFQTAPLLTVSVPVGLGFGSNSGTISVQGTGHKLSVAAPLVTPIIRSRDSAGLKVQSGKTSALVGGEIAIANGMLTSEQGRVELGSVGEGLVNLKETTQGFALDYTGISNFKDIKLSERSLIDTSGVSAGFIQVAGRQITLNNGSMLLVQSRGGQAAETIRVKATESLVLTGNTADSKISSGLLNETLNTASGGNINVTAPRLLVENGAIVQNKVFSTAPGGDITINSKDVQVTGTKPITSFGGSNISTLTFARGKAGNVTLQTQGLFLSNGGSITASNFNQGSGDSGNVTVKADTIEMIGYPLDYPPTGISAGSLGSGNAGNVDINTRILKINNSATVSTVSFGAGNSGTIEIKASELVSVNGRAKDAADPSQIRSSVNVPSSSSQRIFKLSSQPTGNSGDVIIKTPSLKIADEAKVTVNNEGTGKGGTVRINADWVRLNKLASISAETASGDRGNIFLSAQSLQLRNSSKITTNAIDKFNANSIKKANGGKITIDAKTIVQLANSDISANAPQGKGGDIQIHTQGIFNSPDSDISATGEINGEINIFTPDIKQQNNLVRQRSNFNNTDTVAVNNCLASRNVDRGQFVVTGTGGLQESPISTEIPYSLVSVKPVTTLGASQKQELTSIPVWKIGDPVLEATQLLVTKAGRVILADELGEVPVLASALTCQQ